jgi:hypothetical protein
VHTAGARPLFRQGLWWSTRYGAGDGTRMKGSQIAALIFAILLLLPGGCCLFFGVIFLHGFNPEGHQSADFYPSLLLFGLGILAVAGLLFWVAFRPRNRGNP